MIDERTLARWRREREAYYRLLELPPDERAAAFAEVERGDPELAAALRRPLAEAEAGSEESHSAGDGETERLIGRFRLLRRLGTGGMGEVHLAERVDDVAQKVALKFVRSDLPVPTKRARRERQILARLNHPNIAGLIDAGVTDSGQPWFAMAYVDGERITAWCDHRQLNLHARARLFAKVCRAVQFAHKNLVLHRDLKPSNILVSAEGAPMLLDFGIAKLLDVTDPRETQTLALTPAYAAPEQLRGEAATTASDVYQLGLVLYELLGGIAASKARESMPARHDGTGLPRLDHTFAALVAREPAAAARIAGERSATADKLRRQLRGDLGRIVSKAAADAPHERYDTAQALADDLDRWTRGLPVSAHRGSFAYRARKLIRRHAVAAVAVVLLSVGLVATSLIAVQRARTERAQREQAEQQRRLAEQQRGVADQQRQRAETLLGFVRDVLHEAEPEKARGEKLAPVDLVTRAATKLEKRNDLDPTTRAVLQTELADTFTKLGHPDAAENPAQQAEATLFEVRQTHPLDYLRAAEVLSDASNESGHYEQTLTVVQRALGAMTPASDGSRPWRAVLLYYRGSALSRTNRYEEAERDLIEAVADLRESGNIGSADGVLALNALAVVSEYRGELPGALASYQQIAESIERDPLQSETNRLQIQTNIARICGLLGRFGEAESILEPLVPRLDSLLGPKHDRAAAARSLLAIFYMASGDYTRARVLLEAASAVADERSVTPETFLQLRMALARLDAYENRLDDALAAARNGAAYLAALRRPPGILDANVQTTFGEVLLRSGAVDDSIDALQRAVSIASALPDAVRARVLAEALDVLGRAWLAKGSPAKAVEYLRRSAEQAPPYEDPAGSSALRRSIHRLWAEFRLSGDPSVLAQLNSRREALVGALGSEEKPQVWQLDWLIGELQPPPAASGSQTERRARAEAGLRAMSPTHDIPRFVGINR